MELCRVVKTLYEIPEKYDVYKHKFLNESLEDILKDGVHQFQISSNLIDVLIQGMNARKNRQTAIICFSGAIANRNTKKAPFFSGLTIASVLDVPLIAIADPTISSFELNLAWYAGNEKFLDLQIIISKLIERLAKIFSLNEVLIIGGSGGGFACLVQAKLLSSVKSKVFVWNPQTSISKYNLRFVGDYIKESFTYFPRHEKNNLEQAYKDFLDNNHIINSLQIDDLSKNTELIYFQNIDDSHTERHLVPFMNIANHQWKRTGVSSFYLDLCKTNVYIGNWGKGHAVPPKELIYYVLTGFLENKSGQQIIVDLYKNLLTVKDNPKFVDLGIDDDFFEIKFLIQDSFCKVLVNFLDSAVGIFCDFAYYLINDGIKVQSHYYSKNNSCIFDISSYQLSSLSIIVFLRMENGKKIIRKVTLT